MSALDSNKTHSLINESRLAYAIAGIDFKSEGSRMGENLNIQDQSGKI